MSEKTRVVTGLVRLSYPNLFEPKSINGSGPKYSAAFIIPKSDKETIAKIEKAVQAALEEGKSKKFGGKIPNKATLKLPLRDGDTDRDEDPAYADAFFVNANATKRYPPVVVDRARQEILDESEVYSGCYVRASLGFYAFNTSGNKGVACSLRGIQKIKEGEPLGAVVNALDDFDEVDDDFSDDDDLLA